jgi:hypothetical protein
MPVITSESLNVGIRLANPIATAMLANRRPRKVS